MDIPQLDVVNVQGTGLAVGVGDLFAAVKYIDADIMLTVGGHGINNIGSVAVQGMYHTEVQHALLGQGGQLDRTVDTGIVVEVKVRRGNFFAVGHRSGASGRQHRFVQLIVGQHSQMVELVVAHNIGNGSVKRQETALVGCHLHTVDKDAGTVSHRAETHGNILALPLAGDKEICLVPEIAAILAGFLVGKEIAERSRHRHGDAFGQVQRPAAVDTLAFGVEGKAPHTVQAYHTAGAGIAGIQQRFVFHGHFLL